MKLTERELKQLLHNVFVLTLFVMRTEQKTHDRYSARIITEMESEIIEYVLAALNHKGGKND